MAQPPPWSASSTQVSEMSNSRTLVMRPDATRAQAQGQDPRKACPVQRQRSSQVCALKTEVSLGNPGEGEEGSRAEQRSQLTGRAPGLCCPGSCPSLVWPLPSSKAFKFPEWLLASSACTSGLPSTVPLSIIHRSVQPCTHHLSLGARNRLVASTRWRHGRGSSQRVCAKQARKLEKQPPGQ